MIELIDSALSVAGFLQSSGLVDSATTITHTTGGAESNPWALVGTVVGGLTVAISIAYNIVSGHAKRRAESRAEIAESAAANAASDAATTMYTAITERLQALEKMVDKQELQLEDARKNYREAELRNRRLEMHVIRLEALMRVAGLEVPAMDSFVNSKENM